MPICKICGIEFPNRIKINGVTHVLSSRNHCLNCVPLGTRLHKAIQTDENGNALSKYSKLSDSEKQRQIKKVINHRRQIKIRGVKYKGGKCCICGYNRYVGALQFHHYNPEGKSFNISTSNTMSWDKMKKELDKCILVCSNCHAEIESGYIDLKDYPTISPTNCDNDAIIRQPVEKNYCIDCGKVIDKKATRCLSCHRTFIAKNIPDKDTLTDLIQTKSYEGIGRLYGVTGKAVKKWCKKYNIA